MFFSRRFENTCVNGLQLVITWFPNHVGKRTEGGAATVSYRQFIRVYLLITLGFVGEESGYLLPQRQHSVQTKVAQLGRSYLCQGL